MMPAILGRGRVALLAVLSLGVVATEAAAGELFVMPYRCSVGGSGPVLTPSADQGYQVIGRKDQRPYSACSESNPDVCKRWTVYRFDINCGGARVPWVDVAAAISASRDRHAWAEGGRLHIEMPARWSMAPDDPCSQQAEDQGEWHGGGFARFCAERRGRLRGAVVEIPDGFAPLMGLDAIFVADGAPAGAAPAGAPPGWDASPRPPPQPRSLANAAPVQDTSSAAKPERAKPTPLPARTVATPEFKAPPVSEAKTPPPPAVDKPATKPDVAKTDVAPPQPVAAAPVGPPQSEAPPAGTPLMPTVINGKNAAKPSEASAPPADKPPEAPIESPAAPQPAPAVAAPTPPVVTASIDAPNPDDAKPAITDTPADASSPKKFGDGNTLTAVVAGALSVLVLAGLFMMRWRDRSTVPAEGERDIATVSFDGAGSGRGLIVQRDGAAQDAAPLVAAPPPPPPPHIIGVRDIGSNMPQTREQALDMLGMGVAPAANEAAIKKIVDGLRQSWHPDLAQSDAERQLRELRMKQINAAWAIISGASGDGHAAEQSRQLPPNAA